MNDVACEFACTVRMRSTDGRKRPLSSWLWHFRGCKGCNYSFYCLFVYFSDDYVNNVTLGHILELLTFCVEHHTYHIKNYVISKDLLRRVLVLMKSRHKFLVLSKFISMVGETIFLHSQDIMSFQIFLLVWHFTNWAWHNINFID